MKKLSEKSRQAKCVKLHQALVALRLKADRDGMLDSDVIAALDYHKHAVLLELFMDDIIEVMAPSFQRLSDRITRLEKKTSEKKKRSRT